MKGKFCRRALAACLALLMASGDLPAVLPGAAPGGVLITASAETYDFSEKLDISTLTASDVGKSIAPWTTLINKGNNFIPVIVQYANSWNIMIFNYFNDSYTTTEVLYVHENQGDYLFLSYDDVIGTDVNGGGTGWDAPAPTYFSESTVKISDITWDNKGWRFRSGTVIVYDEQYEDKSAFLYIDDQPPIVMEQNASVTLEREMELTNIVIDEFYSKNIYLTTPDEVRKDISKAAAGTSVTVTDGAVTAVQSYGKTLTADKDYTARYFDSAGNALTEPPSAPGRYCVLIEGKGAYKGVAAEQYTIAQVSGTCGDSAAWQLTENDDGEGTLSLTISGSGVMADYTTGAAPWYPERNRITRVVVEDGITEIGESAFDNCSSLASVTLPEGLTSIGDHAFFQCGKLTGVVIPAGVTTIGSKAFYDCEKLAVVEVDRAETIPQLGDYAFCGLADGAKIYVVPQKAEEYRNATNWSDHAGIITGMFTVILPESTPRGSVSVDRQYFSPLTKPTVTVTPDAGYVPKSFTLNGAETHLTDNADGTYACTVSQPGGDITVGVKFVLAPVTYLDENGVEQTITDYTVLTGNEPVNEYGIIELSGGTYVVNSDIRYEGKNLQFSGDTTIILCDGAAMTIDNSGMSNTSGIYCAGSVTVSGQSGTGGTLDITSDTAIDGIGVTINGCTVKTDSVAGILSHNSIALNGGTIIAEGSDYGLCADGGGDIIIGGAEVTASSYAATGSVRIKDGCICTEGAHLYKGTLTDDEIAALKGQTIAPACKVTLPAETELAEGSAALLEDSGATYARKNAKVKFRLTESCTADAVLANGKALTPEDGVYTLTVAGDTAVTAENTAEWNIISEANITLAGELGLNFYIAVPDQLRDNGAKIVMNGREGRKETAVSTLGKLGDGRYRVSYNVKAIDMDKPVTLQIQDSEGNVLSLHYTNGDRADNNTFTYSVNRYVETARKAGKLTEDQMAVVNAMYTYGAYSARWKYGTDLPDEGLNDLPEISREACSQYALKETGASDAIELTSLSLVLDSNTRLRLYFTCTGSIAGHKAKFRLAGSDSGYTELEIHSASTAGKYYVEIANIGAKYLKKAYSVVFDDEFTVEASAMTYVYNSIGYITSEDVNNVIKALCAYSDAADAY